MKKHFDPLRTKPVVFLLSLLLAVSLLVPLAASAETQPGTVDPLGVIFTLAEPTKPAQTPGTIDITVTFNLRGGDSGPSNTTVPSGSAITFQSASRTGYNFLGWNTDDSSNVQHAVGASYTVTAPVIFYAVWQQIPQAQFTVTYNANGGSGGPADSNKYFSGDNVQVLFSPEPTRAGYTFLGWDTNASATAATYAKPGPKTLGISANTTLYAVWQAAQQFTVTYNENGGVFGSTRTQDTNKYTSGSTVQVSFVYLPTRQNYTFLGWATSAGATAPTYPMPTQTSLKTFVITANTTLYAVWSTQQFTVTYNENGGVFGSTRTKDDNKYTSGSTVTVSFVYLPTRQNYTFLGWAANASATTPAYPMPTQTSTKTFVITANTTLYAVWKAETQLTVTYNANGGTGIPIDSKKYFKNDTVTILYSPLPTRKDYLFLGWDKSGSVSTPSYTAAGTHTFTITESTMLYAVWKFNGTVPAVTDPPTAGGIVDDETTESAIEDTEPAPGMWDDIVTGFSEEDMAKINEQTGLFFSDLKNGLVPGGSFGGKGVWSVLNLLLALLSVIITIGLAVLMVLGYLKKDDAETPRRARARRDVIQIGAIAMGLIVAIFWLLLDKLNHPAVWVDIWTGILLILFVAQLALLALHIIRMVNLSRLKKKIEV